MFDDNDEDKQIVVMDQNLSPWQGNPYLKLATSHNTRKAYQSDIRHFEKWGGKLPATPAMIANYLQNFAPTLNARTLSRRLIALKHWHQYQDFKDPTSHPAIQKTMTGIVREHGKPKNKARPITPDELIKMCQCMRSDNSLTAARDVALILIGFFAALRRSELIAIRVENIKKHKEGIEILLPSSKTDQQHEGQYVAIPFGNDILCPIGALENWLQLSGITQGAIFRRITASDQIGPEALSPLAVNLILKQRAINANLNDIEAISSHSLRRGLATSAAKAGAGLQAIMRAGRWKQTDTVMEYIDASDRFADNAATKVLANIT